MIISDEQTRHLWKWLLVSTSHLKKSRFWAHQWSEWAALHSEWDLQPHTFSIELHLRWATLAQGSPSAVKKIKRGLPWWRSGWESACQCRGHGIEPWSGKIPHAAEQLSPCATTTEPARLEPVLRNKRGCDTERPAHRDEEWPPLATTRESPRTEMKTQHSQKWINK